MLICNTDINGRWVVPASCFNSPGCGSHLAKCYSLVMLLNSPGLFLFADDWFRVMAIPSCVSEVGKTPSLHCDLHRTVTSNRLIFPSLSPIFNVWSSLQYNDWTHVVLFWCLRLCTAPHLHIHQLSSNNVTLCISHCVHCRLFSLSCGARISCFSSPCGAPWVLYASALSQKRHSTISLGAECSLTPLCLPHLSVVYCSPSHVDTFCL